VNFYIFVDKIVSEAIVYSDKFLNI